jgi:hypothetical protein
MPTNMALYLRPAPGPDMKNDWEARNGLKCELEEEMAHQARVYRLVNNLIRNKEATSDDAIGAVAALTSYAVG